MKKLIIIILLLFINIFINAEIIDTKISKNNLGQTIKTETYKDDPNGTIKVEWYFKGNSTSKTDLKQMIAYYKDSNEYREKQIDSYVNGVITNSVTYYLENNPDCTLSSVKKTTASGFTMTTYYTDNEIDGTYLSIYYYDHNNKDIKQELYFKKNKNKVEKVIRYFDNPNGVKEEMFFLKDNKNNYKKMTNYYYDYDKKTKKHQDIELYINNDNYTLTSSFDLYPNGVIRVQTEFYGENKFNIIKYEAHWDDTGVLLEKKYYDKAGNEVKPE